MLQIGLAIYGLYILVTGKFKVSAEKVVEGTPARLLGLAMLTPFPLAFLLGVGVGIWAFSNGRQLDDLRMPLMIGEAGITIAVAVIVFLIARAIAKPPGYYAMQREQAWAGAYPTTPPPPSDPNNPYQPPHV